MKPWYKQSYVHRLEWIMESYEMFGFSEKEGLVILMIEFLNTSIGTITPDLLVKKTGLEREELDRVISVLCAKKYLEIKASNSSVQFSLEGLYTADTAKSQKAMNMSVFELFEGEFGRPLTSGELTTMQQWLSQFDSKVVIRALKEASMYQKLNFIYIQRILTDWKKKGLFTTGEEKA